MIAINLNLGRGCQWTRQDGSWQATCKGAYHFSLDCQRTNAHKSRQWACLQLEGIQFGSCLRPRSSFSLESWRSHPKPEIPGHFAHGLAVGDWSCSSIWSEAETPKHFPIARWFLHIAWAKGLWFFCFFHDRCFREFFTKPLMIDLTVGGSEKAGQIIAQAGKTLFTPCCSFSCSGGWRRDPGHFSVFGQARLDCYRKCYQQKLRELARTVPRQLLAQDLTDFQSSFRWSVTARTP